jgi:drug/metabolite transporter (DMT)-like permease
MLRKITKKFLVYLVLWYGFTFVSAIYTKLYLNKTNDSITFTLVAFSYGFFLKLLEFKNGHLGKNLKFLNKDYIHLSVFNIGSLLLTNIAINQTSVSFIYMIKASEPIFVLFLSYILLGHKYDTRILLTLIQICFGVTLTIIGNIHYSSYGLIAIFFGNLSTASRSVFFKLVFQSNEPNAQSPSLYTFYINTSFTSFLIISPFYLFNLGLKILKDPKDLTLLSLAIGSKSQLEDENWEIIKYLFIGSILNFAYNLFSFKVLENVTSITHSIINIMKRMFVVFGSMVFFTTNITPVQCIGIFLADSGCLLYSYFKSKTSVSSKHVSYGRIRSINRSIFSILCLTMFLCSIAEFNNSYKASTVGNPKIDLKLYNENRIMCLAKIKQEIIEKLENLLPKDAEYVYMDVPDHVNYGDSLIW